jgi:hypothetical protein
MYANRQHKPFLPLVFGLAEYVSSTVGTSHITGTDIYE